MIFTGRTNDVDSHGATSNSVFNTFEFQKAVIALFISSCPLALNIIIDLCFNRQKAAHCTSVCRTCYVLFTCFIGVYGLSLQYFPKLSTFFGIAFSCYKLVSISISFLSLMYWNKPYMAIYLTLQDVLNLIGIMSERKKSKEQLTGYCDKRILYEILFLILTLTSLYLLYSSSSFNLEISLQIYFFVLLTIILTVVPGRIAREEAEGVASKDHIDATKTSYERYFSHELRTPLNTVDMGIKYCLEMIPEDTTN